ncbi:drug/metabolite transporter (DMT)-like permease [Caballeronia udeis]|uniref:Drug/metabolite transporter (DMT)-like permease n=1 Tax=Caballeronia udeis TaxID=1232866 RepID=A0ABW8MY68_9BURK
MSDDVLSRRTALFLFSIVVFTWGINWVLTKVIVNSVNPIWTTAIRSVIASIALFFVLVLRRQLIVPKLGDIPVILAIAVLHMVGFSTLVAYGVRYVPVGQSIVLAYTTPLWVAPAAWLFLKEPLSGPRLGGIIVGLVGIAVLFNPISFDRHDEHALLGNGLIMLAALCWAGSIIYVRAHRWISTPFQLVFWETTLAAVILTVLGYSTVGAPEITWTPALVTEFLFAGVCGTALAYWAMATVNRSLPATTTALGMLATPIVGIAGSTLWLGESLSGTLLTAMTLVMAGIVMGTVRYPGRRVARPGT